MKWDNLEKERNLKEEDNLKNADCLKNENDPKNEDHLENHAVVCHIYSFIIIHHVQPQLCFYHDYKQW